MFSIRLYDSLGSTQDEAARLVAEGAPHGTVVSATRQTAGRGRHRRSWASPPGNVHMTVVLRQGVSDARAPGLGFVAALAVGDAIQALVPCRPMLKWPNDVLVDGAKISGILVEQSASAVLIGIGVNVRHAPRGTAYPVTCLGPEIDPAHARTQVLERLGLRLLQWQEHGFGAIRTDWLHRAHPIGTKLSVAGSASVQGRFAGIGTDGALLLMTHDGVRRLFAGDVAIL